MEGASREGRDARLGEEKEDAMVCKFHSMVLLGKLLQEFCLATKREGGGWGFLPSGDFCNNAGRPVAEVLWEKHSDMHVPPVEKPTCGAFKDYKYLPKMVPLDFTKEYMMWVVSKLSGPAIDGN